MSRFDLRTLRERLKGARHPTTEDAMAAVATVLRDGPRGAEVLLIKRAERDGDPWSGHLAMPGGKKEKTDASLLETSIREAREEVGVSLEDASLAVTRLEDVSARTSGFRVAQFVFALAEREVDLVISDGEVKDTVWAPLQHIADEEGKRTIRWEKDDGATIELPSVLIGEYVLWGMTYRMINQVIALAGP